MDKRVSTGVKGLDKLIDGGIPEGSVVLVSGAPGTGKTIMAMQFLEDGMNKKEKCAYVTIEEPPEKIMKQAGQFGLFKKKPEMISAKDIKYDMGARKPENLEDKIKLVLEKLKALKPKRVVIDSISSLSLEDGLVARRVTRTMVEGLNELGATALVTGEALDGDYPDKYTPFLVDGVITSNAVEVGTDLVRNISVKKMRMTSIVGGAQTLEFTKDGLKVSRS